MKVLELKRQILPTQLQLIEEEAPFILYSGGAGSGKTRGGALKALKLCCEYPGITGMITAPAHNILISATIPTYKDVFTRELWEEFNETKLIAKIKGGSLLYFRTARDPYRLRGATIGFFHMDEGADSSHLAFQVLQARLRQPNMPCQGWITSTPLGFNWLYEEFIRNAREDYVRIKAKTQDNWFLPPEYVERLRESYRDEQFLLQELEGEFIEVGGACPFDMKALNELYQEFKDLEPREELGFIRIFSKKVSGKRYVIGADAATGLGEDESAFIVCLATTEGLEEVCSGKGKMAESEFAELLDRKSREYNNALVIVEDAPVGKATLQRLEELRTNIYMRKKLGLKKLGWPTLSSTKPMMVADLGDMIRDKAFNIQNLDILEQLMSYIRDEKGQFHATTGARDDYVSALMLCVQGMKQLPMASRIQVSYPTTWR